MRDVEVAMLVRFAANAAGQISAAEFLGDFPGISAPARKRWAQIVDDHRWALAQIELLVPDEDLRTAYYRSRLSMAPQSMGAFWSEIERRGLDV